MWYIATGAAVILSFLVAAFQVGFISAFFQGLARMLKQMTAYYAINGTALLLELAALCFVGCVAFALQFYAAMAVGHSFSNHKLLLSVAFYFGFQFVSQIIGTMLLVGLADSPLVEFLSTLDIHFTAMAAVHITVCVLLAATAVYGAIFYFLTTYFLKRRLNLE